MAGRALLMALASAILLSGTTSALPFFEGPVDSEAEATAEIASLPMEARDDSPSYEIRGVHALNGGKPFFVDKDPVTGKVDLSGAVGPSLTSGSAEDYVYEQDEHDGIDRKDTAGTLGRPNDIGGPSKADKTDLHDFLNLPTRYSNSASKYPLISSSYANTKVQGTAGTSTTHNSGSSNGGGIKNHKPYSSSSTQQPHYYPIREKMPTTSEPATTVKITTTTTTTTTTTPRPLPPRTTTTTTEEPTGWGLDEEYFNYEDEEPTAPPKQPHPSEKPLLQSNSHQQSFPTISVPVTAPSSTAPPKATTTTSTTTSTTTTTTTTQAPTTTTTRSPPPKVNVLKPFAQSAVVTPSRVESTSAPSTTPSTISPTQSAPKLTSTSVTPTTTKQAVQAEKQRPSEKTTTTTPSAPTKKPVTNSSNVVLVPEPTQSNKVVFGKVPAQPPEFIMPPARPNPYGSGGAQPFRPLYENGPQDPNARPEQPVVFHNVNSRPIRPGVGDVITVPLGGEGDESEYVSFSFQPPSPQQMRPPAPPRFPGVEPPSPNAPTPFHQPPRPPPSGFKQPAINSERPTKEPERLSNTTRTTAAPSKPESPPSAVTSRPVVFPDEKKDSVPHEIKDVVPGTFNSNPNISPGARPQFIHGSSIPVAPYRGNGQIDSQHPPLRVPIKPDSTIPPFRVQPMAEGLVPPHRGQPPKEGNILPFRGQPQGDKVPPPFRGQPQGEKPMQSFQRPEGNIPPFRGPAQGTNPSLPPFRGQPPTEENPQPFRGQPQPLGEVLHVPLRGPSQTQGEVPYFPHRGQPQPQGEVPHLPPRGQQQIQGEAPHAPLRGHGEGQPMPPRGQQQPENQPPVKRPEGEDDLSSLPLDLMPPAEPGLNRPHLVNEYPRPLWETARPKPPHLFNGPQSLRPKVDTVPPMYGQGPPLYKLGPRIKPNPERPIAPRKPDGHRDQYTEQSLPNILPQFRPNARISNGGPIDPSRTHFVGGPQRMPLMDRPGAGRPHAVYMDGMAPPRPQMLPHLVRGTREDDAGALSDVEIGGDFSVDMDALPPRSVMPRRTGPHISEQNRRVTTLQMMNYQSHRHVPKTDLSGLKPPYPAPFPASEKPMDERSSVFVVYPVNSGPSRNGADSEGEAADGVRGPNQPLPPSTLNAGDDILGHVDMDDDGPLSLPFALNKQQKPLLNPSRERTDAPILKPHRDHPNSLTKTNPTKSEFPYTIVQPDVETKSPALSEKKPLADQDAAATGDDSEINVIPYLQDYLPFATKKPKEAENTPPQWNEKMDKEGQAATVVVGTGTSSGTSAPPTIIKGVSSTSVPSRHEPVMGDKLRGSGFAVGSLMHTLSGHRSPEGDDKKEAESIHLTPQEPQQPDSEDEALPDRESPSFQSPYQNHRLPGGSAAQGNQGFQAPFQASVSVGNSALSYGWSIVSETTVRPTTVDKANVSESTNTTTSQTTGDVVTPPAPVKASVGAETLPFDIENFKPQLFSGFKPIFPDTEESESGQSKERPRIERQSQSCD